MEENFLGELCFQFRFVGRTLRGAWRAIEDPILWQDSSLGRMSLGTPVGPPSTSRAVLHHPLALGPPFASSTGKADGCFFIASLMQAFLHLPLLTYNLISTFFLKLPQKVPTSPHRDTPMSTLRADADDNCRDPSTQTGAFL